MLNEYSTVGITPVDGGASTNQTIGHGFFDGQVTITPSAANNGSVITDAQIQAELLAQVAAGNVPPPVFDAQGNNNTLYMIFFPPGKTISQGGSSSCVKGGFCAYHNSTTGTFASHRLYYGVHPDVQAPSLCSLGCGAGAPFNIVTNVTSHELSEAVTDADVGPANSLARPLAWVDPANSEIGDICVGQEGTLTVNGTSYTVQTEFSNFQNTCAAAPPNFVFIGPTSSVTSGTEINLRVALQSGPAIFAGDYTGTVHFTSSDPTAVLPADYTYNVADVAAHNFVFTLNQTGQQTITATDPQRPGVNGSVTATVAPQAAFRLQVASPQSAPVGVPATITVTALDVNFALVKDYNRTVHFSSSDSAAVLPADTALVNGTGTFQITLNTPNSFPTVTVAEAGSGLPNGQVNINVFTPGPNATTTTFIASPAGATFGQPVTFTATVTGGTTAFLGTPITFISDAGAQQVSGHVGSTGQAQASLVLTGGTHTVFAEFAGDSFHDLSSSAPLTVAVNPAPTTVALTSSQAPSAFGSGVLFTAALSSPAANAVPGFQPVPGIVTFTDGSTPLAVITAPQPGGSAQFSTSALVAGSHSITATYSGNSSFAPSSGLLTQVVNPPPPPDYSISLDKTAITLLAGQSATVNVTTTSLNFFDGTVAFSCGNVPALTSCLVAPPIALVDTTKPIFLTTIQITTTGPHAQLDVPRQQRKVYASFWVFPSFVVGITLILGVGSRKRRRVLAVILLSAFLISLLASCGGGASAQPPPPTPTPTPTPPPSTPAGTTIMTVSATGGSITGSGPAHPTQQLSLSITVQP